MRDEDGEGESYLVATSVSSGLIIFTRHMYACILSMSHKSSQFESSVNNKHMATKAYMIGSPLINAVGIINISKLHLYVSVSPP